MAYYAETDPRCILRTCDTVFPGDAQGGGGVSCVREVRRSLSKLMAAKPFSAYTEKLDLSGGATRWLFMRPPPLPPYLLRRRFPAGGEFSKVKRIAESWFHTLTSFCGTPSVDRDQSCLPLA